MSNAISYVNTAHLYELEERGRNQDKLSDLNSQAATLQKNGVEVLSWHEFNKVHPVEKKKSTWGAIFGAVIGAIVGGMLASLIPPAGAYTAIGAILGGGGGGALGYNYDPDYAQRRRQLDEYQAYLDGAEKTGRSPAIQQGINYRDDHAQQVLERMSKKQGLSIP